MLLFPLYVMYYHFLKKPVRMHIGIRCHLFYFSLFVQVYISHQNTEYNYTGRMYNTEKAISLKVMRIFKIQLHIKSSYKEMKRKHNINGKL